MSIQTGTAEESEGGGPSMVLNASGNPVIVYKRTTTGVAGTWLLTCSNPNCTSFTQNMISSARAYFPSLKLNSAGNPRFTYYNAPPNNQVILVSCSSPTCSSGTVSSSVIAAVGSPGQTSLALDCNSNPVISYHLGGTSLDLRLARENTATSCAHFHGSPSTTAGPLAFEADRGDSSQLTIDVENDGAAGSLLNVSFNSISSGYTILSGLPISGLAVTDSPVSISVQCNSAPQSPGTLVLNTNNVSQATVTYRLTCAETPPQYASSPVPGTLSFLVPRGQSDQTTIEINNTGGDPGSLLDVSLQSISSGYTVSGLPILALETTDPAATLTVECTSAPTAAGTLVLATNDLTQPTVSFSLVCDSLEPQYGSTPSPGSTLAFEGLPGSTPQLTIDYANYGDVGSWLDVDLNYIPPGYSILPGPLPTIGMGTTAALTLTVQCDGAPQAAGTLVLDTNDQSQPTVSYDLSCEAWQPQFDGAPTPGTTLSFVGATGSAPQLTIQVGNGGHASSFLDVSLGSIDAGYNILTGLPIVGLQPGSPLDILVECTSVPRPSGVLVLNTNDPALPTVTYPLICTTPAAPLSSASVGDSTEVPLAPNGATVLQLGRMYFSIPQGAVPPGNSDCRASIQTMGSSAQFGFSHDDTVWDVTVTCSSGPIKLFFLPLTVCIQPPDGVTTNKLVYHNHDGAGFRPITGGSGPGGSVCGQTRLLSLFALGSLSLPATGFAPGRVSALAEQAVEYATTDLSLSIPKLGVELEIVGVPQDPNGWDVSGLSRSQVGYLYGTSFPTWQGNSVLTAHVWNADNTPGPFYQLRSLQHGDRFTVAYGGQSYVYEVRTN